MPGGSGAAGAHRLATVLCGATLALLVFGGLVTNTGSALAVPDWPTTFGQNMFLYPWSKMAGGIFYEHSHRLVGSAVGLLTLALAAWLWIFERRRWLCWLGVLAVALVSIQGILGGLRVLLVNEMLAVLHGSVAPVFFALTASLALFTSRGWSGVRGGRAGMDDRVLRRLALATMAALYVQIVFGAILTHLGRRLEAHLLGASVVVLLALALARRIIARHSGGRALVRLVACLGALLAVQLLLGLGAYVARFGGPELPFLEASVLAAPVLHRVVGAVLLAVSTVLALQVCAPAVAPRAAVSLPEPLREEVAA